MDKAQTMKIQATLSAAYSQAYSKIPDEVKSNMVNVWNAMFAEDDYTFVGQAVKNYITNDTKGFIPPIGAIKEELRKLLYPDELTEQEAVNLIMDRLGWRSSKEAFDSLPPVLQKVVGSASQMSTWGFMDLDTVQSVISSNIQRSLRTLLDQEKQKQRTGQYKPYSKDQIQKPTQTEYVPAPKSEEVETEEKIKILEMIKKAKEVAADARERHK